MATVVEVVSVRPVTGKVVVLVRLKSGSIRQGAAFTDGKGAQWVLEKVGHFVPAHLAAQGVYGLLMRACDAQATLEAGSELSSPD